MLWTANPEGSIPPSIHAVVSAVFLSPALDYPDNGQIVDGPVTDRNWKGLSYIALGRFLGQKK